MRLSKLQKSSLRNLQLRYGLCSAFGLWKKKELRRFFDTIVQFTNACSIHSGFYQWRMIDDNQKMFIPHLAIKYDFFHSAFVNPCMIQNQRRSQSGVRLTANLPIQCIMGNYCTRWRHCFKGLSLDGGRADFSKKPPLIKIYRISAVSSRWTVPLRVLFCTKTRQGGSSWCCLA